MNIFCDKDLTNPTTVILVDIDKGVQEFFF